MKSKANAAARHRSHLAGGCARAAFALIALCVVAGFASGQNAWPTLHRDNQRSGYTPTRPKGSFERKWFRSFASEMIGARVEPIVAEGKVFVPTYKGNVHALGVADGRTLWTYAAGRPIGHSPCYHDGKVYFGVDDAANAGRLVCVSAADGKEVWTYRTKAGIWNHPATDGRKVYVGDRGGTFHAVDVATGKVAWTFQADYMILKPASISPSGEHIVFAAEDMHVYCLRAAGKLRWKSAKLPGLSLRDQAPTIWNGKVIVRTNPGKAFHESLGEGRQLVARIQRSLRAVDGDQVLKETKNNHYMAHTARRAKAEMDGILEHFQAEPLARTWFTLNLSDGSEPFVVPVLYTAGLHNPPTPPTFNPRTGDLYTIAPTSLSPYCDGVSQHGIGIARIDPKTGRAHLLPHGYGTRMPGYFMGMTMITDETSTLTLMGDFLVVTHQGAVGGVDLKTRRCRTLHGKRDTYGGIFGPGSAPGSWDGSKKLAREGHIQNATNEWHGPDRSAVAVAEGRLFWVVGGQVVCFAGPGVKQAPTGGSKAPPPLKWSPRRRINGGNVTSAFGSFRTDVAKRTLKPADIEKYVAAPAAGQAKAATDDATHWARARLDAAVGELVGARPWAPLVVELGISHEEIHFARTGETMQAVAAALPHLSPNVRKQAVTFLDKLFDDGVPLKRKVFRMNGQRREHHTLHPSVRGGGRGKPPSGAGDLYALWAYAHYAGRWRQVLAAKADVDAAAQPLLAEGKPFNPDAANGRAVADLNRQIAGLLGYVRIARRAKDAKAGGKATQRLAALLTERVHFERADERLQSRPTHHATIPRYVALVPELVAALADHAGKELATNLDDLDRELPVWYQAWGERLIGGENYTNSPEVARGIFAAMADGRGLNAAKLLTRLGQPWCKADVYYIEKLTAVSRSPGKGR